MLCNKCILPNYLNVDKTSCNTDCPYGETEHLTKNWCLNCTVPLCKECFANSLG